MQCPSGEIFFQFLENMLTTEQRNSFLIHLLQCPVCAQKIIFMNQVQRHFNRTSGDEKKINGCCSPAILGAFVDGDLEPHENQKIIDHLLECEECLHTLLTLNEVIQANDRTPINVPVDVWKKVDRLGYPKRKQFVNLPVFANFWQSFKNFMTGFFPTPGEVRWPYLIPLGAAIIILLLVAYFPFLPPLDERIIIQAESPNSEIYTNCPVFTWRGCKQIRHYYIEVKCEDRQKIIWQADTRQTSIQFPMDAAEKLICNHHYLWYVKGERKIGEIVSSDSARFYLAAASHFEGNLK
jgi:hypothetical protein